MKFKPNRFLNVRFLYAGFYCIRNVKTSANGSNIAKHAYFDSFSVIDKELQRLFSH